MSLTSQVELVAACSLLVCILLYIVTKNRDLIGPNVSSTAAIAVAIIAIIFSYTQTQRLHTLDYLDRLLTEADNSVDATKELVTRLQIASAMMGLGNGPVSAPEFPLVMEVMNQKDAFIKFRDGLPAVFKHFDEVGECVNGGDCDRTLATARLCNKVVPFWKMYELLRDPIIASALNNSGSDSIPAEDLRVRLENRLKPLAPLCPEPK